LNLKPKQRLKHQPRERNLAKEFDETSIKKMQEMREMYQGRGGNGGGQFRIIY
jgi:hypothetical protein